MDVDAAACDVELVDIAIVCNQCAMAEQAGGDHDIDVVTNLVDGFDESNSAVLTEDLKSLTVSEPIAGEIRQAITSGLIQLKRGHSIDS